MKINSLTKSALFILMGLVLMSVAVFAEEEVVLTVWDTFTGVTDSQALDDLYNKFEELNPGIIIEREPMQDQDMRKVIQVNLSSGGGPDVFEYNTGPGLAGVLAKANLIMPMDKYYDKFNWDDRIYSWTKDRVTFDGKVYGIGNEIEGLGVYYHKDLFNNLGLEEPKTFHEFLSNCDVLKSNGYIPVAYGNQGKWPAYHMFSIFANNTAGGEMLDDIIFESKSWVQPEIINAVKLAFVDMVEKGYYIPGTNGVTYDDGNMLFFAKQAAMHMTGTWLIRDIIDNVQDPEVGFFFLPPIDDKPAYAPSGLGSGTFISANTEYPEEAARLVDFMYSEKALEYWIAAGAILPISFNLDNYEMDPLKRSVFEAVIEISTSDDANMGYNIDVLTPAAFNQVMADGFQAVIADQKTPKEQVIDMQESLEE